MNETLPGIVPNKRSPDLSLRGVLPQTVIASLWGSKLFVEEIASPLWGSQ
jgi:hypothetical protein